MSLAKVEPMVVVEQVVRRTPQFVYRDHMVGELAGGLVLTKVEQDLVDHVVQGKVLDLAWDEPPDEATMRSWNASHTIRGRVLRDIVRGRLANYPDPRGLRLRGARVVGQVDLKNLTSGIPVELYDCLLESGLFAYGVRLPSLGLAGCHVDGEVNLSGGHLGMLDLSRSTLRNNRGAALCANGLVVDAGVLLMTGFDAEGTGEVGAIHLCGARIGGWLNCKGSTMRNRSGPAFRGGGLQANAVYMQEFSATGGGAQITVDLAQADVEGRFVFDPSQVKHIIDPHCRLDVDGLTYSGLPEGLSLRGWLCLLRDATPSYAAQPYQQLAAAHRTVGHDGESRRALMAQRRDQIERRALTGRAELFWARVTGLLLGYGYQSWRALLALFGVLVIAVALTVTLGTHGALTNTNSDPGPMTCSPIEQVGVGLDLGLPLIRTGARGHCDMTTSTSGQILTVVGWALQLLAWAFAALFIAGFTNAVRRV